MPRAANEYERADHDRDLIKHDERPTDIPSARAIARIARGLDEADAGALIQKYADTVASIKVHAAVSETYTRLTRIIEGSFHPAEDRADA